MKNFTVVLSAGGESSRFRNVQGAAHIQKAAFVLPNGETMIERTINMYKNAGFKRFVILLYHNADSVIDLLKDGSDLGVDIKYSHDPEKPVGRGGAMKHAFEKGLFESDQYIIAHNPDDQLVGDVRSILDGIVKSHLSNESKGTIATAIMVPGVRHQFTGFTIEGDRVTGSEMYPFVGIPTHIGMTVFSPGLAPYFQELFDLEKKTDFEAVLFPVLIKEGKLAAHVIPERTWISVNDEKGLKELVKALDEGR